MHFNTLPMVSQLPTWLNMSRATVAKESLIIEFQSFTINKSRNSNMANVG